MADRIIRTARERRLVLSAMTKDAEDRARAYHDLYQRKAASTRMEHPGTFESCPTLRCETARQAVDYSRRVLSVWHPH